MFRRGFRNIRVYDRLPRPPAPDDAEAWGPKEGLPRPRWVVGIGARGQRALHRFGAFEHVDRWSRTTFGTVEFRQDGRAPTVALQKKLRPLRAVALARLSSCLHKELTESCPGVEFAFSTSCEGVEFRAKGATLRMRSRVAQELPRGVASPAEGDDGGGGSSSSTGRGNISSGGSGGGAAFEVDADLVIGADGSRSVVREAMRRAGAACQWVTLKDRCPVVYKMLPLRMPSDARLDLEYVASRRGASIRATPTAEGTLGGVAFFQRRRWDLSRLSSERRVHRSFARLFPSWPYPFLSDAELDAFARRPAQSVPPFAYCSPALHLDVRAVLLGDAIHYVKPYQGLGINSGLEDVSVLDNCLWRAGDDLEKGLRDFSAQRAPDAQGLVEMSHALDQPSRLGTLFRSSLLTKADSVCHKLLPSAFSPSVTKLFNSCSVSFAQIRAMKRRERAAQAAVLAVVAALACVSFRRLVYLARTFLLWPLIEALLFG